MCCIVKYPLYLALVLNYVFHLAFSMCCIAEHLLYLALVWNYVFDWQCECAALQNTSYIWRFSWTTSLVVNCPFYLAQPMSCIAKNSYIWRLFVLNSVFHSALLMSCIAKHLLYLVLCVKSLLSFATCDVVLWKRLMFGAYFAIPLLFVTFPVLTCKIPLLFCACVDLRHLFRTLDVCCNTT